MKYALIILLALTEWAIAGLPADDYLCVPDPTSTVSGVNNGNHSTIEALISDGDDCDIQGMNFGNPLVVGDHVYVTISAHYMSPGTVHHHEIEVELDGALANFPKGKRFTFAKLMAPGQDRVARIDLKKKPMTPVCRGCVDFEWMVIIDWFDQDLPVHNQKFYFPADARLAINYFRDASATPAVTGIRVNNLNNMMSGSNISFSPVESPALYSYQVGIIRTFADIPAGDQILFEFPMYSFTPNW